MIPPVFIEDLMEKYLDYPPSGGHDVPSTPSSPGGCVTWGAHIEKMVRGKKIGCTLLR
jgi:hypothetical protein